VLQKPWIRQIVLENAEKRFEAQSLRLSLTIAKFVACPRLSVSGDDGKSGRGTNGIR